MAMKRFLSVTKALSDASRVPLILMGSDAGVVGAAAAAIAEEDGDDISGDTRDGQALASA